MEINLAVLPPMRMHARNWLLTALPPVVLAGACSAPSGAEAGVLAEGQSEGEVVDLEAESQDEPFPPEVASGASNEER